MNQHQKKTLLQIRFQIFKQNRSAWISLLLFGFLFLFSSCAEILANDKPLILKYDGSYYFPVFKQYPETIFGGTLESNTDYKDPFVIKSIRTKGWMIWPPVHYSFLTVNKQGDRTFPSPPSSENWLGTDSGGRDVFAQILYGLRLSILFGCLLSITTVVIGVIIGAFMGYHGGKIDMIGQRIMEIWGGFPVSYLIMMLSSFIIPSFLVLLGIMLLFSWIGQANLVRYEFLQARKHSYVLSAKALGVPDGVIIFRHILPNALVTTMSFLPFMLAGSITTLTSLDFLGFGLPADAPALGEILAQGKNNLFAPWIGLSGFGVLALILVLLLFVGEGLRDAFDPQLNKTSF